MKLLKVRSTRVERRKQEENITWNKDKVLLFYRYDKEKKNNSSYKEDMSCDLMNPLLAFDKVKISKTTIDSRLDLIGQSYCRIDWSSKWDEFWNRIIALRVQSVRN